MSTNDTDITSIAVIGVSGRFPGADSIEKFWQDLAAGIEPVRELSDAELIAAGVNPEIIGKPNYVKRVSRMNNIEMFDAAFFDFTAREACITSPSQRWLLTCAYEALEDSGYTPSSCDGNIGVYVGANRNDDWQKRLYLLTDTESGEFAKQLQLHIANDLDYAATRISYKLNLKGPSINISTACSTSLVAVHQACRALLSYECDMALAGGGNVLLPLDVGYLYESGGIQSSDGRCRAFAGGSDGTIFGSGVGVVVLKRLEEAVADGDNIYAVVRGSAINNDGFTKVGFTAPSVVGQSEVISAAMAMADVQPDEIDYVETHGTGTALGDPIEVEALTKAYRAKTDRKTYCAIGSVKSNIGHLGAAAGIAGFIKAVLALKHECIPPSLHFDRPNPEINFEGSPFYVITESRHWPRGKRPRRAGVSSFGVGGTNAHVILEEAPPRAVLSALPGPHLFVLSGRSESALNVMCTNLAASLSVQADLRLADVAYTLNTGRTRFQFRRSFVARDIDGAVRLLKSPSAEDFVHTLHDCGTVAFMFPGQGAQHVNMMLGLYRGNRLYRDVVDQCCGILQPIIDIDLRKVLFPESDDSDAAAKTLMQTSVTQPALFVVEYALARLLQSWGIRPGKMIGHSIGEYVAACIAGVFGLEDALRLVAERGRLMQSMPAGDMLAVPLSEAKLLPLLGDCELAAVNGPEWCVVSGATEAIERLAQRLAGQEVTGHRLHTSHAFHSSMMEPMLDRYLAVVRQVRLSVPTIPFISNVSGDWIRDEQATDPAYWVRQLRSTVRFFPGVEKLIDDDSVLLEVGPSQTLVSLAKTLGGQQAHERLIACCRHLKQQYDDETFLLEAVGRLWKSGVDIDWRQIYKGEQRYRVSLPTYSFEMQRYWLERPAHQQTAAGGISVIAGNAAQAASPERSASAGLQAALAGGGAGDRQFAALKEFLIKKVSALFGTPDIRDDVPLIELGMNSLMAIELRTQINAALECDSISIIDLLDETATINHLASVLADGLPDMQQPEVAAATTTLIASKDGVETTDSGHALETHVATDFYLAPDPANTYQPFALTSIQQAYWIGRNSNMQGGDIATYIYIENDFRGLDLQRYEDALNQMIQRHHMMRMVVRDDGMQQFLRDVPRYTIAYEDLSREIPEVRERKLLQVREEMSHQVLDPSVWPLFEVRINKIAGDLHRIHYGFDFMIVDALSMMVFFRDLFLIYSGETARLQPLEITFRDYVTSEHANRETEIYARARRYWLERMDSLPPAPQLPFAKEPTQIGRPRYRRLDFRMDSDTWSRLKNNARRHKITASVLIANAYAEVLAQWCQSPRFTLNLTIFNRPRLHPQMNDLMGDFTSSVLLEADLSERLSFIDSAKRLQKRMLNDLENRHFNGVEMLRAMNSRSGGYQSVIMPVVLTSVLGLDQESEGRLAELSPEQRTVYEQMVNHGYTISQTSQVWLDHVVREQNGELICNWDAVEELFPPRVLDDMFCAYYDRLIQLANEGDAAWQSLRPIVLPAYQEHQLQQVNRTEAPVCEDLLQALFDKSVQARPGNVAVFNRGLQITYAELQVFASQIGRQLRDAGVQPNELVAIVMDKGWEQIVAVLGILYSGAAYMPVDASLPEERILRLLQQGEIKIALTQAHRIDAVAWPAHVQTIVVDQRQLLSNRTDKASPAVPAPVQKPSDLAYVLFTSGSTGTPKGVMIDHESVVNTVLDVNRRFDITENDRAIAINALNFDLSVYDIFGLLAAGGALVMPDYAQLHNPRHWAELVVGNGVTLWNTVPAIVQLYIEELENAAGAGEEKYHRDNGLRYIMMSGDWIPVNLPDRIRSQLPQTAPISLGGPTETTIWSIYYPIGRVEKHWKSIPYGKPLTNRAHHILHTDLSPCPYWVTGDIYTGGRIGLAHGYWRDEEKTNRVFIRHPETGERIYRTGDLGRFLPDGNIEFIGRVDNQVKVQGHRIELGEIEFALRECESVREAVVVAVGDGGDSGPKTNMRLVAFVVDNAAEEDSLNREILDDDSILTDPLQIAAFKLGQHGLRRFEAEPPSVMLPGKPERNSPLQLRRVTHANRLHNGALPANAQALSLQQFGDWLSCLGQVALPGHTLPKYYFPSPGSTHPVQAYLYIGSGAVQAVGCGIYYYDPQQHRLLCLLSETDLVARYGAQWRQRLFVTPIEHIPFAVFLLSFDDAVEPIYGKVRDERFFALEAGHMEYLLTAAAPGRNIALNRYSDIDTDALKNMLGMNERYRFVDCLLGGIAGDEGDAGGDEIHTLDCVARQSYRTYLRSDLARHELETLFACLVPQETTASDEGSPEIYVYCKPGRVEDLPGGFYRYDIAASRLQEVYRLQDGEVPENPQYTRNRVIHTASAFTVFYLSRREAGRQRIETLLLTGYLSQALLNNCANWNIGLCSIAGVNERVLQKYLGTGDEHEVLYCLEGGGITPEQTREWVTESMHGNQSQNLEQGWRETLRSKLPYYMVPGSFVRLPQLPLTANGKVDRKALMAMSLQGQSVERAIVPPRDDVEEAVAAIWRRVLEVEELSVDDNLFELGGDSLTATRLIAEIDKELGVGILLHEIFGDPTLEGMANSCKAALAKKDSGSPGIAGEGSQYGGQGSAANLIMGLGGMDAILTRDARLHPDIRPDEAGATVEPAQAKNILLTGATGFLGAYVLRELLDKTTADIHCLARAGGTDALKRVKDNLRHYGLWKDTDLDRINVIDADLSKPRFALSDAIYGYLCNQVEVIYHVASLVNYARSYEDLKKTNVQGAESIIRLACTGRLKAVNVVSSKYVCFGLDDKGLVIHREEAPIKDPDGVVMGYTQSKWVAESLFEQAKELGVPVVIVRPGQITGASQGEVRLPRDAFHELLKLFVAMKSIPARGEWNDGVIDVVPVDFAARVIVELGLRPSSYGKYFNLVDPDPLPIDEFFTLLSRWWYGDNNNEIRVVSFEQWAADCLNFIRNMDDQSYAYILERFFIETEHGRFIRGLLIHGNLSTHNLMQAMEESGLVIVKDAVSSWGRYFSCMKKSGSFPFPVETVS